MTDIDQRLERWIENQERVTVYRHERTWYVEWFDAQARYNYRTGATLKEALEASCSD